MLFTTIVVTDTHLELADACAVRQVDALGLCVAWQLPQVVKCGRVPCGCVLLQVPKLQHEALECGVQALHLRVPAVQSCRARGMGVQALTGCSWLLTIH